MVGIRGKTVLVTGAGGYIGNHLSKRLLREGAAVRAMDIDIGKAGTLREFGASVFCGDITDLHSVEEAVKGCQVIFHLAGILGDERRPREYFRKVNVGGTRILAEAAMAERVERFLYMSTAWVYGFNTKKDTEETSPLRFSKDPYCDSKAEAELFLRENAKGESFACVIVQPTQIYGPGDETWTLGPLALIKSYTMVYPGFGKGLLQPLFIDDAIEGTVAACQRGRVGEAYLLCGSETVQVREFFGYLARMVGRKWIPQVPAWLGVMSAALLERLADLVGRQPLFTRCAVRGTTMSGTYSCRKAREELGFSPKITLHDGMEEVAKWVLQHRDRP